MVLVFLMRLAVSPDYELSEGKYSIVFFSASCLKTVGIIPETETVCVLCRELHKVRCES